MYLLYLDSGYRYMSAKLSVSTLLCRTYSSPGEHTWSKEANRMTLKHSTQPRECEHILYFEMDARIQYFSWRCLCLWSQNLSQSLFVIPHSSSKMSRFRLSFFKNISLFVDNLTQGHWFWCWEIFIFYIFVSSFERRTPQIIKYFTPQIPYELCGFLTLCRFIRWCR